MPILISLHYLFFDLIDKYILFLPPRQTHKFRYLEPLSLRKERRNASGHGSSLRESKHEELAVISSQGKSTASFRGIRVRAPLQLKTPLAGCFWGE